MWTDIVWRMDIPSSGVLPGADGRPRCWWSVGDPLYERYHDREWGRPVKDDRRIFEKISLEAFQSGLSWLTILRKREGFREAFRAFDVRAISRFDDRSVERLMRDSRIVRNRAKIEATINNAKRCIELVKETGSLSRYLWSFEPSSTPRADDWGTLVGRPASQEAKSLSKDLKRRGWSFVGPTTLYSAMESLGLVNDHVTSCFAWGDVESARTSFERPAG